jgi:hypothetical protein
MKHSDLPKLSFGQKIAQEEEYARRKMQLYQQVLHLGLPCKLGQLELVLSSLSPSVVPKILSRLG